MLLSHAKLGLKSGFQQLRTRASLLRTPLPPAFTYRSTRQFSRFNDQIYIHEVPDGIRYSYSPQPEAIYIGQTPASTPLSPQGFEPNPSFVSIVHHTIGNRVAEDFSFIMEAGVNVDSYMPIYDFREVPRHGRVPEIENIFGYVQVDSQGKIVPGSYQDNVMYRVYSGTGGLPKLSDFMYEEVQKECESQAMQ